MRGSSGGGSLAKTIVRLMPTSTVKVVPMTPTRYSSAKLKHQALSCDRHATAVQATTRTAVPNAVPAKRGLRTIELIPFHAASACSGDNALSAGAVTTDMLKRNPAISASPMAVGNSSARGNLRPSRRSFTEPMAVVSVTVLGVLLVMASLHFLPQFDLSHADARNRDLLEQVRSSHSRRRIDR